MNVVNPYGEKPTPCYAVLSDPEGDDDLEQWEDIEGFEGKYQVSNLGRVKSLDRIVEYLVGKQKRIKINKGKILTGIYIKGYVRVVLNLNNSKGSRAVFIHRLVCLAFIPNPDNKETVNHKNMIRNDNRLENLEWNTYSENNKHSYANSNRIRPIGERSNSGKLKEKDVLTIRNIIKEKSMSINELAKMFNVDRMTISRVKHRKSWTHI